MPDELIDDESVFPERAGEMGVIYVEAEDKVTISKIRDVEFVKAYNIVGIVYNSRSGMTRLRWERTVENQGKVTGEATIRSLVHLAEAGVIGKDKRAKPQG
ncbi:MAG: hypothetical protein QXJ75_04610 [Candidatus Bathyarchaeia archaeon]